MIKAILFVNTIAISFVLYKCEQNANRMQSIENRIAIQSAYSRLNSKRITKLNAKISAIEAVANNHSENFTRMSKAWSAIVLDYYLRAFIQANPLPAEPDRTPAAEEPEAIEVQG